MIVLAVVGVGAVMFVVMVVLLISARDKNHAQFRLVAFVNTLPILVVVLNMCLRIMVQFDKLPSPILDMLLLVVMMVFVIVRVMVQLWFMDFYTSQYFKTYC